MKYTEKTELFKKCGQIYEYVNFSESFYRENLGLLWKVFLFKELAYFPSYSFVEKLSILSGSPDLKGEFLKHIHTPRLKAVTNYHNNNKKVINSNVSIDNDDESVRAFFSVCREIYTNDMYQIEKFISDGDVVLDIGANIGLFSIAVKELFPNTQIIAFEPERKNYNNLKKNTDKYKKIVIHNKAVGESTEKGLLRVSRNSLVHSLDNTEDFTLKPTYFSSQETEIVSLDNFIKDKPDVIKFDIEGYERFALEGAKNIIRKDGPTIIISADHSKKQKKHLVKKIKEIDKNYKISELDYDILVLSKKS
jgi:FkbM family methyltransferase